MPVEMFYNIKCDMCGDVKVDGPYDLGIDGGLHLAPIPWVQLDDWVIVDYKVICSRHKIQIFKGYGHRKKRKSDNIVPVSCTDSCLARGGLGNCSLAVCACDCHWHTKEG